MATEEEIQAMRDCAERHNVQVWCESSIAWDCEGTCNDGKLYPLSVVNDQPHGGCPDCGEAFEGGDIRAQRWWWQTCCPGCMPDSDVFGPYDSEAECLDNATDGLMDES